MAIKRRRYSRPRDGVGRRLRLPQGQCLGHSGRARARRPSSTRSSATPGPRPSLSSALEAQPDLVSVNGHADHSRILTAEGDRLYRTGQTPDPAESLDSATGEVPLPKPGSFHFAVGCHAGLSVPDWTGESAVVSPGRLARVPRCQSSRLPRQHRLRLRRRRCRRLLRGPLHLRGRAGRRRWRHDRRGRDPREVRVRQPTQQCDLLRLQGGPAARAVRPADVGDPGIDVRSPHVRCGVRRSRADDPSQTATFPPALRSRRPATTGAA